MRRYSVLCLLTLLFFSLRAVSDWPGFRGPASTGAVADSGLFEGATGLSIGWKRSLGSGYSAPVVGGGRVVAMFTAGESDVVAAFDPASGEELWRHAFAESYPGHDGSHDGPISTPLVGEGRVFGLGPRGHLFAVKAETGESLWAKHLVDDLGAKSPFYGFTSSPLLVDGVLVVEMGAPEGGAIAGFDPATGELKWKTGDDTVDYHSPIVAELGGRRQVVAVGMTKLFGLDPTSGDELWSHEHGGDKRAMGGRTIVPLPAGEGRIFVMNKIDASTMFEISAAAGGYEVSELWSNNKIRGSYVTPVYHHGHIFAISGRILACVDAATGELKWRSREPGDGFLTVVDDKLVVLTKPGSLHVLEASSEGYQEIASLELFEEHSWSEIAVAEGGIFARSMAHLARIDVGATDGEQDAKLWVAGTDFGRFLAELDGASDKGAAIDAFLERQSRFPIVEGTDTVHFVFRGEATDVGIVSDQIGFRREDPMSRVPDTDFFHYSVRLEPDAAVTYGFIPDYGEAIADPLNPAAADSLFGEVSWLAMPAWREPDYLAEAPAERRGQLEDVQWEHEFTQEVDGEEKTLTEKRTARVYLPAGFDAAGERRYGTVYFPDGRGALEDGSMKNTLDHLVGRTVAPVVAVFVLPPEGEGDEEGRRVRVDETLEMLKTELVPLVDERFPTIRDRRARAVVGASDAGVTALRAGIEHSELFGLVGIQSAVLFEVPFEQKLDEAGRPPLTLYMDWGTYDLRSPHEAWDMAQENRDAWAALRERGYRPAGGEQPEGHSWGCWTGHSDELLTALFPLPGP